MATRIKRRRGNTNEINSATPALAEWWHNTDDNSIHTGDGLTAGGHKLATDVQEVVDTSRTISNWIKFLLEADARNVDALTGNNGVVTGTKEDFDSATMIVDNVKTVLRLTDDQSFIYTSADSMSGVITEFNTVTPSITVGGTEHTLELIDIRSIESSAEGWANAAEGFANAAAVAGKIYPTVADGLAATPNGENFLVQSSSSVGFADLFLNNGGSAVAQGKTTLDAAIMEGKVTGANTDFILSFESIYDDTLPEHGDAGYWQSGNTIVNDPSYKHSGRHPVETGRRIVWKSNLQFVKLFEPDGTPITGTLPKDGTTADGALTAVIPAAFGGKTVGKVAISSTVSTFDEAILGYGNSGYVRKDGESIVPLGTKYSELVMNDRLRTQLESIADQAAFTAVKKRNSVTPEAMTITEGFTMGLDRNDPDFGEVGYVGSLGENSIAGFQKTNFLPVQPGMAYGVKNSSTSHIGYYNENKEWIGSVSRGTGLHTVPDEVNGEKPVWIRHGFSDSQIANYEAIFGYGRSIPEDVTGTMEAGESSSTIIDIGILEQFKGAQNPFKGKEVALFGDSITASSTGWHNKFSEILSTNKTNFAASGGHWEDFPAGTGNQWFSKQIDNCIADTGYTPDLIMIAMGTNSLAADYGDFNTQVSGEEGSADRTTIWGGMRSGIERLLVAYPNAKVVLMTPLQRTFHPPHEGDWLTMNEAVKKMGAWFSLPVIDCGSECGISYREETIAPKYLSDGLHPNAEGSDIQGAYTATKLKSMLYPV